MNDQDILTRNPRSDKARSDEFCGRDVIVIFARAPIPGQVKTRLAKTLGNEKAAQLYAAMLCDTIELAQSVYDDGECEVILAHTPDDAFRPGEYSLRHFWQRQCSPQGKGDLSARLLRCFQRWRNKGCRKIVVIGSDAPDLTRENLRDAFYQLDSHDLVVGPTLDGGFYLIGASTPLHASLFRGVRWSTSQVLRQVSRSAEALGWHLALLDTWRDVDDTDDLFALVERLKMNADVAPHTRRVLASWDVL